MSEFAPELVKLTAALRARMAHQLYQAELLSNHPVQRRAEARAYAEALRAAYRAFGIKTGDPGVPRVPLFIPGHQAELPQGAEQLARVWWGELEADRMMGKRS